MKKLSNYEQRIVDFFKEQQKLAYEDQLLEEKRLDKELKKAVKKKLEKTD